VEETSAGQVEFEVELPKIKGKESGAAREEKVDMELKGGVTGGRVLLRHGLVDAEVAQGAAVLHRHVSEELRGQVFDRVRLQMQGLKCPEGRDLIQQLPSGDELALGNANVGLGLVALSAPEAADQGMVETAQTSWRPSLSSAMQQVPAFAVQTVHGWLWCRRAVLPQGCGAAGLWCRRAVVQEGYGAAGLVESNATDLRDLNPNCAVRPQ